MKLIITEKPSVARDIAAVLKLNDRRNGFIEGRNRAITWAFGHLLTLREPSEYDPALKRWSLDTLPFVPERFELKPIDNPGVAEQLGVIARLCEEAEEIVCATDAGREGELIFRQIVEFAGCAQKPIRRLWLSSLTPTAIREAFRNLKDGREYDALYAAARCRSEADWIVGLNATRCFSVRYGRIGGGEDRVLWSAGRVQTPVLAMIVRRDDEISHFRSEPFWEVTTRYRDVLFKHVEGRFAEKETAGKILERISGNPFEIVAVEGRKKKEQPPQLFDLTTLQRELNKSDGLSAADVLAAAQKLYESKLLTYPRTDSRYLSSDAKPGIRKLLEQLEPLRRDAIASLDLDNLPFSKRIFDDKKVTDHHAIIPTGVRPRSLGPAERLVYDAVLTRFVAVFLPPCLKRTTTVEGQTAGERFRAKGVVVLDPGWTILYPPKRKKAKRGEEEEQSLPSFEKGESGPHEPSLREGKTKPPKRFTENSLLGAMEAAGKQVEDDALREALKERGIGTPATRAAIIETLLHRHYVRREKKLLLATDMGRCLIALVRDPQLKSPEMTGEWEAVLKRIERGEDDPETFMKNIVEHTRGLVERCRSSALDPERIGDCPRCGQPIVRGRAAYGCSDWRKGCDFVLKPEYRGRTLSRNQIQVLLRWRVLPYPLRIAGQSRLLLIDTLGRLADVDLPDAARQRRDAPQKRASKKPAGRPRKKTSGKKSPSTSP